MSRFLSPELLRLAPYVPGEQPQDRQYIKLNTNENPYPPAKGVEQVLKNFDIKRLRLYPDVEGAPLKDEIAKFYNVDRNKVFVGVGSDDVLAMSFLTFFNSKEPVLFPDITYSFYKVWAELFEIPYKTPKLDENFRIKKEDYFTKNGGIVIANPNAPTSIAEGLDFIEDILKNNKESVVIVDEAYVDFGAESAIKLIDKYDNLLVVQTFSKSRSMAGMRIGYAIGNETLINALNSVKNSYNSYTMSSLAIACGVEAVRDTQYFDECCKKIINTRENTIAELKKLGFICLNSSTNFLFVSHTDVRADVIFKQLREKNIFVRYFNSERIDNYLRITVGTDEEMEALINALKEMLHNCK